MTHGPVKTAGLQGMFGPRMDAHSKVAKESNESVSGLGLGEMQAEGRDR